MFSVTTTGSAKLYISTDATSTNKVIKKIITICVIIILFSFIGVNNNVFTDQLKINQRDAYRVNRLLTRLEMNPNFNKVKKIQVVGGHWTYGIRTETAIGDMNISAFAATGAKLSILKEITGIDFEPLTNEDIKKIDEYCIKNADKYSSDSVEVIDDIGLLLLK